MSHKNISDLAREQQDYMVAIRRDLHRNPELSLEEAETSRKICSELDQLGIPYEKVGDYGVIATIEGLQKNCIVALRADMDALPIQEENDHLEFCSQKQGVSHACGHDGHVAMLLGAARIFKQVQPQLKGTVKLCFQQAEEVGKGALEILDNLKKYPVKTAFGIHLWSEIETGRVSVEAGPRMAASDGIQIVVHGSGTHGAYPSRGVDPILTAATIISNLAAMMAREVNPIYPSVLTFGKIEGGEIANSIPEKVILHGTLRTTNVEQREFIHSAMKRIVKGTADTFRATAEIIWLGGVPVVQNNAQCSAIAEEATAKVAGEKALIKFDTMMASENYGEFVKTYPGVFALIGIRNENIRSTYPHHHPKFNIDEAPFWIGAGLHVQYAIDFFEKNGSTQNV